MLDFIVLLLVAQGSVAPPTGAPNAALAGVVPTLVGPPTFATAQDAAKQVAIMATIRDTAFLISDGNEERNRWRCRLSRRGRPEHVSEEGLS